MTAGVWSHSACRWFDVDFITVNGAVRGFIDHHLQLDRNGRIAERLAGTRTKFTDDALLLADAVKAGRTEAVFGLIDCILENHNRPKG
jgi:hypothetical protein